MKKNLSLKISAMHCQNCSKKIRDTVKSMPVENLDVSYEKGRLTCITEDEDQIIDAINKMGYTAEVVADKAV